MSPPVALEPPPNFANMALTEGGGPSVSPISLSSRSRTSDRPSTALADTDPLTLGAASGASIDAGETDREECGREKGTVELEAGEDGNRATEFRLSGSSEGLGEIDLEEIDDGLGGGGGLSRDWEG